MTACPDKKLLVHSLADRELDAANALAIEQHMAGCAGCRAEYARVMALRSTITDAGARYAAPPTLARNIEAMLAQESTTAPAPTPIRRPPAIARHVLSLRWWTGAATGLAAGLAVMLFLPQTAPPVNEADALVAGHLRALLPGHEVDVPSSERHVVKPWFAGRVDFAPPVPDLAADGFPLSGGRLDFLGDRKVAALVYRRRLHVINVFVGRCEVTAAGEMTTGSKSGFNIVRWRSGDLDFSAVSDLNKKELEQFRTLFIQRTAG